MYTRCTHCLKWFRIRADVLRAARGQVRCSHCGNGFDALLTLREELPLDEIPAAIDPRLQIPLVDAPLGDEPDPARSALEPDKPKAVGAPTDVAPEAPDAPDEETSDEMPGHAGEGAPEDIVEAEAEEPGASADDLAAEIVLDARRRAEIETLPEDEPMGREQRTEPSVHDALPEDEIDSEPALEFEDIDDVQAPAARDLFSEFDTHAPDEGPEDEHAARAEPEPDFEPTQPLPELARTIPVTTKRRRGSRLLWGALSLVALLALGVELVHMNRQVLSMQPTLGPWVRKAYARLGLDIPPRIDLRAFVITHTEVTSAPNDPAALVLSGMLVNHAAFAQPFPILHVSLTNRWGEAIGERFFTADQYLRDTQGAGNYLGADTSAVLQIKLVDPGPDAVGFAVEPCKHTARGNLCLSKLPHPQS